MWPRGSREKRFIVRRVHPIAGILGIASLLGCLTTTPVGGQEQAASDTTTQEPAQRAERPFDRRDALPVRDRLVRVIRENLATEQAKIDAARKEAIAAKRQFWEPQYPMWRTKVESYAWSMTQDGDDEGVALLRDLLPVNQRAELTEKLKEAQVHRLARRGDIDGARKLAETLTGRLRDNALLRIEQVQFDAGDFAGAAATLGALTDDNRRESHRYYRARERTNSDFDKRLETGDYMGALELADSDNLDRDNARSNVAGALWKAGDLARATSLWDALPPSTDIARDRATAGDYDGALQMADREKDPHTRSLMLAEIGEAAGKNGNSARARGIFARATALIMNLEEKIQADTWATIATAQASARDFDGARATADRITGSHRDAPFDSENTSNSRANRANVLYDIAMVQAEKGTFQGARLTLQPLDARSRAAALDMLNHDEVNKRVEAGDLDGATLLASQIRRHDLRAWARLSIAEEQAKRGQRGAARNLTNLAWRDAQAAVGESEEMGVRVLQEVLLVYWLPPHLGGLNDPQRSDKVAALLKPKDRATAWGWLYDRLIR